MIILLVAAALLSSETSRSFFEDVFGSAAVCVYEHFFLCSVVFITLFALCIFINVLPKRQRAYIYNFGAESMRSTLAAFQEYAEQKSFFEERELNGADFPESHMETSGKCFSDFASSFAALCASYGAYAKPISSQKEIGGSKRSERPVRVGCGAGFAGDRIPAAKRLLESVDLDYLVLECLAERTLAEAAERLRRGGCGYDPRLPEWLRTLLPIAIAKGVTIVTNMGAADPEGAANRAKKVAQDMGLEVVVAAMSETADASSDRLGGESTGFQPGNCNMPGWTYLGADAVLDALSMEPSPNIVITGRVADPSLFLAPMIKELNWRMDDWDMIAKGTVASHLLECGCQLTGGYFAHPQGRYVTLEHLETMSLPYAEVYESGKVILCKTEGSGGELSVRTCSQQLLYEVQDPSNYYTPDVIADFSHVTFLPVNDHAIEVCGAVGKPKPSTLLRLIPKKAGWKAVGEISYGGDNCLERGRLACQLVSRWMEEVIPGSMKHVHTSFVGADSLYLNSPIGGAGRKAVVANFSLAPPEVRLRMDGLFDHESQARQLCSEVLALYTNGPAGGGGVSTRCAEEVTLVRDFVGRSAVEWVVVCTSSDVHRGPDLSLVTQTSRRDTVSVSHPQRPAVRIDSHRAEGCPSIQCLTKVPQRMRVNAGLERKGAKADRYVRLYEIAHSRAGDKGDAVTLSLIPYDREDFQSLREAVSPSWVLSVFKHLLGEKSRVEVYPVEGVGALNIVLQAVLDGGVTISRRLDRHGKSLSDLLLSQRLTIKT